MTLVAAALVVGCSGSTPAPSAPEVLKAADCIRAAVESAGPLDRLDAREALALAHLLRDCVSLGAPDGGS